MDQRVIDYLNSERMCVLAVCLTDGTPHTAAMHFAFKDGTLYFSTHNTSRKTQNLASGPAKASVTIGTSEEVWKTLQLDGTIAKTEFGKDLILAKYPETADRIDDTAVFLKFTPTWYRYTDYKTTPPTFIENK